MHVPSSKQTDDGRWDTDFARTNDSVILDFKYANSRHKKSSPVTHRMMRPSCEQCKHFIPSAIPRMSGHCAKFRAQRPELKHANEFVFFARLDPTLCGESGRHFEPKKAGKPDE